MLRIIAVSKQDLPSAFATLTAIRKAVRSPVYGISAVTGSGIKDLVGAVYNAVRMSQTKQSAAAEVVLRPKPKPTVTSVMVKREGRSYRLSGRTIERVAAMTDLSTDEGQAYFQRALVRTGARRKLERAGAKSGDRVRVGDEEIIL